MRIAIPTKNRPDPTDPTDPTCASWQSGVMLLALMIFMAIVGIVVTKTAEVWSTTLAREREQELLFVGDQYRQAIERYYYATPGSAKALPATLEDLAQDDRFPKSQRHLRQTYLDPMQGGDAWGVVRQGSRIVGVYSLSEQKPMKKSGFDPRYSEFSSAQTYRGWRFVFRPPVAAATGSTLRSPKLTTPAGAANDNQANVPDIRVPAKK